jgi:hypothetical protein
LLAEDLLAEDLLAEDLLAEDLLAEDLMAEDLLAEDLLAEDLHASNVHRGIAQGQVARPRFCKDVRRMQSPMYDGEAVVRATSVSCTAIRRRRFALVDRDKGRADLLEDVGHKPPWAASAAVKIRHGGRPRRLPRSIPSNASGDDERA